MADGNKVQYWVEVALQDKKLRDQLKEWNWKEIMGLDDLSDVFSKEGDEAVAAFNKAIASTDINWEKVLGSKKFKSAIYGMVTESNKQLREGFFSKKDAAKVTEFIGALSEAMSAVGTSLDTDGLVRSLTAFSKAITPIRTEIEALADAPEKVKAAFDKVFGDKGIDLTPTINAKGIVEGASKTIEGVGDVVVRRVHEVSKEVQKENNRATKLLADLNRSNVDTNSLKDITSITKKLGSLYSSYEANLARATKAGDDDAARFAKDIFDTIAYAEKEFETFSHERIFSKSQLQDIQRFFNEHVSIAKRAQEDYRKEVEKAFQLDLADKLTENLKSLNVKIALPKQSDFTKQINKLITDVNKKRLEKIKTTIDISSELSPKTKKEREALDQTEVDAIEKKFAIIDEKIDIQQQSILQKTREWRKNMQNAIAEGGANSISFGFKWDSADVDQIASDIFENLQEFFAQEDHKIALHIDEEALFNGIKGALGDKKLVVGGGGGSVNIDPASIREAISDGIRSAILGESIVHSKVADSTSKQKSSSQQNDSPNLPKHKIDVDKAYATHLIDAIKDIAKSATKENKDGNLNQKQKDVLSFFSNKGINLRDLGDTDEEVAKLLEQALFTTDEQGKIRGSDLIDSIKKFKANNKVQWKSLDELTRVVRILLTSFGEETEYEDAKTVDSQSADIIKDASKKAKGVRRLRGIKNYYNRSNKQYNDRNLPTEENIDQIIALSSEMETDGLLAEQLTLLKEARQKLGDKTDEQSVAEFQAVYQEVWSKIEKRFYDLINYLQAFSGELDVEGRKTPVKFSNRTKEDKGRIVGTLANLKEDIVIKHAEIYTSPNDQSIGMGIKSPKTGRASQGQERALLKGSNTSFTVRENRDDELAVRNRTYSAIDNAATSYFSRGDTLQRLGLSTNDVGESDKTVEDYNKLIATEEERLKAASEASALSEQFRQDVKKLLGKPTEYSTPTLDKKAIQGYYDELEEQQKKLAENQLQQEKINQALADNAEWLEKVWPQEMETARQSGDTAKQQALLSRRDAVLAGETRSIEQKHILRAEESAIKNRIQTLTGSVTEGIQKPISNVIAQTLAQLQRLGVEHQGVTQGTPEEYAIVGKAQDLLHVLQSAEQDAIQRLEQFGINVDSLLTQEQKEIIELATETFITSQQDVKKNIRRNVVDRPTGGTYAIESDIDKLKNERDELIQRQEAEHLRNLVENSKLSGEVLEGLQAESEIRRKKYDALGQADQVQSNLSLAYSKRSDASSRINYAEEQKGKLDRFGLSARGTYANDVLEERKKFYANEFFSSDWYYNEVQHIRSETTKEMQAVEEKIIEKHKKWKQVVDKTKQEVIKEVASESVDLEQIRTSAEEEFTKSKKYKNITKSQDRKKQTKLAEIQKKIDNEVAQMVEEAMTYQSEAIDAEAKAIAGKYGRSTASDKDIEQATSRVKANVEQLSRDRVNAKYANDIELVDSEMRMYLENAIVQAGERAVQQAIDNVVKSKGKEVGRRIYEAIDAREEKLRANSKFKGMTGNLLTNYDKAQQSVYDKRKQSIKELNRSYYDNLISEDGVLSIPQSQNEDGTWVVTTEDVRAIVDARLDTILKDAKDDKASAQENVDKYSSIKSNIISENGLTEEEVYNRKLAQAMLLEQERQVQYKEDIELLNKVLEDEGLGDEQKKIVRAKIRELETNLQDSILTEEALQTRRDAVWTQRKTAHPSSDEKIAKNEERIASYNESIEKSQNRQTQLRTQIAELAEKSGTATDEEKRALEEQQKTLHSKLEDEKKTEDSLKRDRARRKKENEKLKETPVSEVAEKKPDNSIVGAIANAIKEAIGGKGGIGDTSGLAKEDTLAEILAVLTGGKVVENSAYKEAAATIQALEKKYSGKPGDKVPVSTQETASKNNKKLKESLPDYIENARKYNSETIKNVDSQKKLAKIAQNLVAQIEKTKEGTKEAVELQLKLQKVINKSGDLYKKSTGEKRYKIEGQGGIGELLGIGDKANLRLSEDSAKKILGNEKAATIESEKRVKNAKQVTEQQIKYSKKDLDAYNKAKNVQPQTTQTNEVKTDVGLGSIAREDTLSKILEVLNAFKSDGVKVTGKKQGETKEKEPKIEKTEAELIKERALKDKDAVLGIAANNSKIKKQYTDLVKLLEAATDIGDIRKYAQKVSALGFNIKKESAEWDAKIGHIDHVKNDPNNTRIYDINNPNAFGKRKDKVRNSMERLAQSSKFNPQGKEYTPISFDGTKLIYQLEDAYGNVEKVTMEWSELNNQVAITSEKSISKLNELATKIGTFDDKFKSAIDLGYLGAKDKDLKKFQDTVAKINDGLANGESADKIKELRNEALRIADQLDKKVSKNKRAYSGTTEINAVERQRSNIGILDKEELARVKEYNDSYSALMKKFNEFKSNGTLFDPQNQEMLRKMAVHTKTLGKDLEKAASNSERLEQAIRNSGTYNGQDIGARFKVEDSTHIYDQMTAKLKELGAEHIKVDRIRKIATGTIRHNNRLVSDLTVEYNELEGALVRYQKQERESLTGIPAFINGFQKKFNSIMQYLTMTMSIHQVMAQLRQGVQYIKEIDLALTELRKVTDETEESYERFLQTAAKTGARLGATISAVTQATATFAKLGFTMSQATEMAEAAIVYKNVGDNIASTEDAADSIISTMKGFGLEATESMAIVDKFNEVGNRFAITSQGIGEALRLSASALNEGGNSLDESIALITAANEVVNDPSSVGTALKTLTLRLRGSKTELEEMGEDVTDMATTTSQLQAKLLALTGGKVDIMLDANTFKNTTQILREMAGAWEDMNDIQRASALELMGGKRQANTLSALIQNFDTVEEAIEASAKSAGKQHCLNVQKCA